MRSADGIDPLNINLDELGQAILVQVENVVVDEVESVANNDQGELVSQFSLLEATTLLGTLARKYTLRANVISQYHRVLHCTSTKPPVSI